MFEILPNKRLKFETKTELKPGGTIKIATPELSESGMSLSHKSLVKIETVEPESDNWFKITAKILRNFE